MAGWRWRSPNTFYHRLYCGGHRLEAVLLFSPVRGYFNGDHAPQPPPAALTKQLREGYVTLQYKSSNSSRPRGLIRLPHLHLSGALHCRNVNTS